MSTYLDSQQRQIRLGRKLGAGGEGAVFEIADDPARVAKIYHRPVSGEKAEKLRAMAAITSQRLTAFASWPLAVLGNGHGDDIAGIILPRVRDHKEIHTLYSPAQRKLEYPDKDWAFLLHAAMNCAAAFDAIHSKSHVIGDVNQGNVLVSRHGTVFLIDCDSFQVRSAERVFPCDVGVPQFTPPELQGRNFRGLERTANHDRFGLALLIFHLLFMGRHPFAGRFLGATDMPIERAIAEYRYAFSGDAAVSQMDPPPQSLLPARLSLPLAEMFERAFTRGSEAVDARPTAAEWHQALSAELQRLRECAVDRGHKFPVSMARCPWCQLMLEGAPNFFLSVTFRGTSAQALDITPEIETVWKLIERHARPVQLPLPPVREADINLIPTPPPPAVESAQSLTVMVRFVMIASFFALWGMLAMPASGYISLPIFAVFSLWWLVLALTSGHRPELKRRRRVLRARWAQLKHLKNAWKTRLLQADAQMALLIKELAGGRDQMIRLKTQYEAELHKLGRTVGDRQRAEFLQGKFICDFKIDRISVGRQATLASYGIETAYDVDYNRILAIPGMGPDAANSLCAWRSGIERQFTVNKSQAVAARDQQALLLKYAQLRQQYEIKLRQGPERLGAIERELQASLTELTSQIDAAQLLLVQAAADVKVMENLREQPA